METETWWVDIPTREGIKQSLVGASNYIAWTNVATFNTKEKALQFIREHIGSCDDDGMISLLTRG